MSKVGEHNFPLSDKVQQILIIYFTFSGQTVSLLNQLSSGLKEQGVKVVTEKIRPINPLRFPVGSIRSTICMMFTTFLRFRIPIKELSPNCSQNFDLIILAGPTWSYNPSGPVLSLLDSKGKELFGDKVVIPLISCRGYWRRHWYGLRKQLKNCGASVPNIIAFKHPVREPWSTIGVFLKIAGKNPEELGFIGKHYTRYGHSRKQFEEARRFGRQIGEALNRKTSLSQLNFLTPLSQSHTFG